MADVIAFPTRPAQDGNGAREALIALALTLPSTVDREGAAESWADWILVELWMRDFKIVPVDG